MQENEQKTVSGTEQALPQPYVMTGSKKIFAEIFEILEMLASVTVCVMLCFAFVARLNIVDGHSMDQTLADKQYLVVSDAFYTPEAGDIVVIHDVTATPYDSPIVKRVIAVGGQTVEIDFRTWTLKVDGEVVEEPYRFLDYTQPLLTANYNVDANNVFTLTVPENEIFVMGDNRNGSGDSRQAALGTIDERCVVGRAYFRIFPLDKAGRLW